MITIELKGPATESSFRRAHAYARRTGGPAIALSVHRERDGWTVSWNTNRGAGWSRGWTKSRLTQEQAGEFAATKWVVLLRWLARVEAKRGGLPNWTC